MYFYERKRKGERLSNYHDEARELEYRAKRTDDPKVKVAAQIAHAAKVRAEGQILNGATHWSPDKAWNAREID